MLQGAIETSPPLSAHSPGGDDGGRGGCPDDMARAFGGRGPGFRMQLFVGPPRRRGGQALRVIWATSGSLVVHSLA